MTTTPQHLRESGSQLWEAVTAKYALRADELRVLEDACSEADIIDMLRMLIDGDLMTTGSKGQMILIPAVSEIRQHRAVLASLMRQLKLPEDGDEDKAAGERSAKAREAAQSRWARRGA